eukprot:TRINITY_DN8383_c0_g1_i18.p1 TRINITY_DN8383_c0_g1~~TRINITY_DN8383_c0_g1_i18.p1  ORF type:complete len:491 (+),score=86.59 TRINITY_DN8383_c0_g1_i18:43-1515(+)
MTETHQFRLDVCASRVVSLFEKVIDSGIDDEFAKNFSAIGGLSFLSRLCILWDELKIRVKSFEANSRKGEKIVSNYAKHAAIQSHTIANVGQKRKLEKEDLDPKTGNDPSTIISQEADFSSDCMKRSCIQDFSTLVKDSWERIHLGSWKDLQIEWRQLYMYASILRTCTQIVASERITYDDWRELSKQLDQSLIVGHEGTHNGLQSVIQSVLSEIGQALQSNTGTEIIEMPTEYDAIDLDTTRSVASTISLPLSRFYAEYLIPQKPVLIRGGAYAWPAVSDPKRCWKNLVNIRNAAGHRTVPVEFGSHYLEKDFTLQMMTIQEFIDSVILCKVEHTQSGKRKGYLAQHQLFDQIPSLRKDIITPDYCCMTERKEGPSDPIVNAWFGPRGTVSPLHFDPSHNMFVQVVGKKYFRLYSPEMASMLYPHEEDMLMNSSQVDVENVDSQRFPLFQNASYFECIVEEGDILYIPPKWWHFVRSIQASFSVSFWWD